MREIGSAGIVGSRTDCAATTRHWQALKTTAYRTQRRNATIGLAVYAVRPARGTTFDIDGVALRRIARVPAARTLTPDRGLLMGISANSAGAADPAAVQSKVAALGIRHLREDFTRSGPGTFDRARWDRVFADAAAQRLAILPLLTNAPDYTDHGFVAAAVARYGPGGTFWREHPKLDASFAPVYWEVGNEPYYKNETAQAYAQDFKAAVVAGRGANPAAKFLVAAYPDWRDPATNAWKPWVDTMYGAVPDLNAYMAGWTVHPYNGGGDPARWTPDTSDWNYEYQQFLKIHQRFAAHGAADVPMWITEVGWTTHGPNSVTAQEQAEYMATAAKLLNGIRWAQALFYYQLQDWGPRDGDPEHWYGVLQADGSPKLAYSTLKSVAGSLVQP